MTKPRVSIGLPVYNGEKYIEEAINSILEQSYRHFELIISDNCSNDKTENICRYYAKNDKRIKYSRTTQNYGAARNFNRVVGMSSGEYFKWAAHDDICGADFLLRCVYSLDQHPSAVLCFCKTAKVDRHGSFLKLYSLDRGIYSPKSYWRFYSLVDVRHSCVPIFGLIRSSVLKRTKLIQAYAGSDRALLVEIGLAGKFIELDEILFFHREHADRSTRRIKDIYKRIEWFDRKETRYAKIPYVKALFDNFIALKRAKLGKKQKAACEMLLFIHFLRMSPRLIREVRLLFCRQV